MRGLPESLSYRFVNGSTLFSRHCSMVADMLGCGEVLSFALPYECAGCGGERARVVHRAWLTAQSCDAIRRRFAAPPAASRSASPSFPIDTFPSFAREAQAGSAVAGRLRLGLPYLLVGSTLSARPTQAKVDLPRVGLLSLVTVLYISIKFLWAPLLDRYSLGAFLGRRRGWMVPAQLGVAATLWALGGADPTRVSWRLPILALCLRVFFRDQ